MMNLKMGVLLLALTLSLTNCQNQEQQEASPSAELPRSAPTSTQTTSESPNPSGTLQAISSPQDIVTGLDTPWEAVFLDNNRILITERPGKITLAKQGQKSTWLDLSESVNERGEGGLMGLAMDPNFAQNQTLYVTHTYSEKGSQKLRLLRLKAEGDKGRIDKVLIDKVDAATNHNGGRLRFGPDGKLYWSVGELFDAELAQSINNLNGKILRLNADGSIPVDNPIPNSLIYSFGHRNPQGLAWDAQGRLFSTEHGPSGEKGCCQDELNWIQAGKNYGWPKISGDERATGLEPPLIHSGNNNTWAPGGLALISQGPWKNHFLIPALRGQAVIKVPLMAGTTPKVGEAEELYKNQFGRIRQVVVGPRNGIYLLTSNRDGRYRARVPAEDDRLIRIQ